METPETTAVRACCPPSETPETTAVRAHPDTRKGLAMFSTARIDEHAIVLHERPMICAQVPTNAKLVKSCGACLKVRLSTTH